MRETPFWRRYQRLFGSDLEADAQDELETHIALRVEDLMRQGRTEAEGRAQAAREFGDMARIRREMNELGRKRRRRERRRRWWAGIGRDTRFALRRLTREPGFSVPVIATLALGLGAATAMFVLVNAVLIRPLPYHDADRLVSFRHAASRAELPMEGMSPGVANYYEQSGSVFSDLAIYSEDFSTLTDREQAEVVRDANVTPSILAVLQPAVFVGHWLAPGEFLPERFRGRLISHSLWIRRYGGDPEIVGKTIELDRRRTVVDGVLPPGFGFPHNDTDVWNAWTWPAQNTTKALLSYLVYEGIARLAPGVTIDQAQQDINRLVASFAHAFPDVTVEELEELGFRAEVITFKEAVIGHTRVALLLLMGSGAFLLLITWANAINLALARAERRQREVAVARALGASLSRVARAFFIESFVLATLSAVIALGLASIAIRARFGFAVGEVPRLNELSVDGAVLWIMLGLTGMSASLLGAAPLVNITLQRGIYALAGMAGRVTARPHEQRVRRALVVSQVALALTLLIGSALMAKTFWRLSETELGFDTQRTLTFHLAIPPLAVARNDTSEIPFMYHRIARIDNYVLSELRALGGVEAAEATSISAFPLTPAPSYYNFQLAAAEGVAEPREGWPYGQLSFATPGYFDAMGIPILSGRAFDYQDTGREAHGIILSASLARALFGELDPVGRRVRWARPSREPDYTVVGVVGDVPGESIREGPTRAFYFPNIFPPSADTITGVVHVFIPNEEIFIVRTRLPVSVVLPQIRRIVREVDPKLAVTQVRSLEQVVASDMARTRLTMLLLLVASLTALALGVIGVYGLLAYSVSQRTKELSVRIALGQPPAAVVRMVVIREGMVLALAGVIGGVLAAFALTRYLQSLLYEVSATDASVFGSTALVLFLIAVAASYIPARRAARINPVRALQGD